MPPVLALLFWIWFAISVVVLVRRRVLKRRAAGSAQPHDGALGHDGGAGPDSEDAPAPTAVRPGPAPEVAHAHEAQPAPVPAAAGVAVASAPGPADAAPLAPTPRSDRRSGRRGAPAADVAEALVGIRMPCDLVPLVFDRLATDHIALSTVGHRPEDVGTALADELERLGYALTPLSDRQLGATRGVTGLVLTISPPDRDGRHDDHPQARDDAVVVEIALR